MLVLVDTKVHVYVDCIGWYQTRHAWLMSLLFAYRLLSVVPVCSHLAKSCSSSVSAIATTKSHMHIHTYIHVYAYTCIHTYVFMYVYIGF